MSPKEKEKYDNLMKISEKAEDNNEIVDNMIMDDDTKRKSDEIVDNMLMDDDTKGKSKDDEIKTPLGSNPTDIAMTLLQINEKA